MLVARSARLVALVFVALVASASDAQRVAWTTSVDASPRLFAALHPLTSDASGNVFVLGEGTSGTTSSIVTVKLTPTGAEAWRVTLQPNASASAQAITTDPAGNVYIAASVMRSSPPGPAGADYLIVKYDPGGSELWRRSANVPRPFNATPSSIVTDALGNAYVTGGSKDDPHGSDFFTLKYAPDGTELWRALTDGGSNLGDYANAIALDAAGNVFIAGATLYQLDSEGGFSAGEILKYDSAGKLQWQHRMGGVASGGVGVAVDSAGNAYLATQSTTYLFGVPYSQLAKFDVQGNLLWSVYPTDPNTPLFGDCSGANGLALDRSGNAYITGFYCVNLLLNSRYTYFTMKYDASGAEQWRAIDIANLSPYGDRGNFAVGLVVNANDDVIVTGQRAYLGPGTTMKYGAGGQQNWSVGQPAFTPTAIARGPANSVYVAGTTATGLVVQKIVDDAPLDSGAAIPATGPSALLLLALAIIIIAARHGTRPGATRSKLLL